MVIVKQVDALVFFPGAGAGNGDEHAIVFQVAVAGKEGWSWFTKRRIIFNLYNLATRPDIQIKRKEKQFVPEDRESERFKWRNKTYTPYQKNIRFQ
ncbi:hypothetical protein EJB05_15231, partial [Eragrostis curvula]